MSKQLTISNETLLAIMAYRALVRAETHAMRLRRELSDLSSKIPKEEMGLYYEQTREIDATEPRS